MQAGRFFIYEPVTGWKTLSDIRWKAIYDGEDRIPELAGKTVRMAVAIVELRNFQPIEILEMTIFDWKIGDDGFIDRDDHGLPFFNRSKIGALRNVLPTDEDIEAIARCLGIHR